MDVLFCPSAISAEALVSSLPKSRPIVLKKKRQNRHETSDIDSDYYGGTLKHEPRRSEVIETSEVRKAAHKSAILSNRQEGTDEKFPHEDFLEVRKML